MPNTVWGVTFALILILPGFLSYRSALARSADASRRTSLWQLSAMLEYSVYIHALGVSLFLAASGLTSLLSTVELHYGEVPREGIAAYLSSYPSEAALSLVVYLAYVIVAAELMGAFQAPHRVAGYVSRIAGVPSGKIPLYPRPAPANPEQPVWYEAFHEATNGFVDGRPQVLVRMKSGDWYHGELAAYPIVADDAPHKDFSISKARYAQADSDGTVHSLADQAGGGTVLLNTSNVESIQVYYVPFAQDSSPEPQAA